MADKPTFKHYPLPPEGVELMRQYDVLNEKLHADIEALQKQFEERAKATHAAGREQLREIWYKMAAMAGVDADSSWDSQDWHVESRYVESGFAALTFYPRPSNPFMEMFGGGQKEEPEAEAKGPPPGATLN